MKQMHPFFLCLALGLAYSGRAQTNAADEATAGRISPRELSIPASPVFDLMGVTPAQVTRTSDIKDFKVDWSFKSWRLNPNLALQSQPVWELFYNRGDLGKYQRASPFMHRLSSVDVSIGSVQDENNDRRIGFAVKLNLLRSKDPLLDRHLYADIAPKYKAQREEAEKQLRDLRRKLDTTSDILQKPEIRTGIQAAE
ncbi:MAG TPA: hypothetical protein VHE54_13425, partial [Puia sp.]|nr:hypothetical protein [Puia sp.]